MLIGLINPTQSNLSNTSTFYRLYFFSLPYLFQPLICCSSFVSMVFEDALAGLPSLGQSYARLPRQCPFRVSVRRIVVILHGDQSDRFL